jgi:hypothetical protein
MIRIYPAGFALDEDIVYDLNGSQIFLPNQRAALAAVIIETEQVEIPQERDSENNESGNATLLISTEFKQPQGVFFYENQQIIIPLKYLYFNNQFIQFEDGLDATAYILQGVSSTNQGMQVDEFGAMIYISPKIMRGYLAQKYLLNDPFDNFPNFELVHAEQNIIRESLVQQGANLNEFIYFQGFQGPIKIWEINYEGDEKINEDYLDRDYSKYIDWKL